MKSLYIIILLTLAFTACTDSTKETTTHDHNHEKAHKHKEDEGFHISKNRFEALGLIKDTLKHKAIKDIVEVNGYLEVPPQNEATITAIVGANIKSISIIEGEKIKKGQVLAYLQHPDLIEIQSRYIKAVNELEFLSQNLKRVEKLYKEEVTSGKNFQETKSSFNAKKGEVNGLKAQLEMLSLSPSQIEKGNIYALIPVKSPINGYVRKVHVKTGQFVSPSKEMFDIVNNEHVHADLMVFEKDVTKVRVGQEINFTLQSAPGKNFKAEIFSVGKAFEQDPKAVHIHADIINKEEFMLPGMYVSGQINTKNNKVLSLPNDAISVDKGKHYAFVVEEKDDEFTLKAIALEVLASNEKYSQININAELRHKTFLQNKAYYMLAEMQKDEAEHSH